MAQRVQRILEDDLDGSRAAETVRFTLDGVAYEIDLSHHNATQFRAAVSPFVHSARRSPPAPTRPGQPAQATEAATIRAWATTHGYELSPRGRLPAKVRQAYANATT